MELYVGMDVSLKQTSICVVDGRGGIVSEGTVNSEPAAIAEFIKSKAGRAKRIGLETGPATTWLWHELRALALPVICIDARHAKAVLSLPINKSDRWRCRCRRPGSPCPCSMAAVGADPRATRASVCFAGQNRSNNAPFAV